MVRIRTGDVFTTREDVVIETDPLHTCVYTALYDSETGMRGVSHASEPYGDGPEAASAAVEYLVDEFRQEASLEDTVGFLAGGSTELVNPSGKGRENRQVARDILEDNGIPVAEQHTGGHARRDVRLYPDGSLEVDVRTV